MILPNFQRKYARVFAKKKGYATYLILNLLGVLHSQNRNSENCVMPIDVGVKHVTACVHTKCTIFEILNCIEKSVLIYLGLICHS